MGKVIAFDYDETWTEDPPLFEAVARAFESRGWRPIIVTARHADRKPEGLPYPVFCTGLKGKRDYMLNVHDTHVAVWVDDVPEAIGADYWTD
jgi:hypothetical protein